MPLNTPQLAVSTVHLESLDNRQTRVVQLKLAWEVLRAAAPDHALLMGDFNFSDGWPDSQALDPTYVDLWCHLQPLKQSEESYATPPTGVNAHGAKTRARGCQLHALPQLVLDVLPTCAPRQVAPCRARRSGRPGDPTASCCVRLVGRRGRSRLSEI